MRAALKDKLVPGKLLVIYSNVDPHPGISELHRRINPTVAFGLKNLWN